AIWPHPMQAAYLFLSGHIPRICRSALRLACAALTAAGARGALSAVVWFAPWATCQVAGATPANSPHDWRPMPDEIYLQELGRKIPTTQPLTCVATYNG